MFFKTAKYLKLLFCKKTEKEFFLNTSTLLGFVPKKSYYFRKAFTHKSANILEKNGTRFCNERLEFLGDTVIDSIIADYLFRLYPNEAEGFLTKMKSKIVSRSTLNKIAIDMNLNKHLNCNIVNLKQNDAMGNAFEALIGAIYLDKGYDFTKKYLINEILNKYVDFKFIETVDKNYKSQLLEITQKRKYTIEYRTSPLFSEGKTVENDNNFETVIFVNENSIATAKGVTKKTAEQNASKIAIDIIDALS